MNELNGKSILITGAARRIGRTLAVAAAKAGAAVIIHHSHSDTEAAETASQISAMGCKARIVKADFSNPQTAAGELESFMQTEKNLFALVNNAAIFKGIDFRKTSFSEWQRHMDINLTTPFLLSQAFSRIIGDREARIINILDWRALRPGKDHFPYTISKAALATMTHSLALILAPNITVNGLALGAILPPADGKENQDAIIDPVPLRRWANPNELAETFIFLLTGPEYITGEIIHLDGGRHLV